MPDTDIAPPRAHHFLTKKSEAGVAPHELVFYDWGPIDDAVPVLCVHGLTRNARDFDWLAPALAARGRRVIAISMAGRGESAWLTDSSGYNYGTYVTDCLAILDNFHLRQVDWIGTSMGGIIGMTIAGLKPDRIRKLVLNDIGATLKKPALERIFANVRAIPESFASHEEAERYIRTTYAPFGLSSEEHWREFIDISLKQDEGGTLRLACDPRIVDNLARDTSNFTKIEEISLAEVWKKVTCPSLILRGAQSDILDEETITAMRAIHLQTEAVTIDGVGHAPALMDAHQIGIVINWLEGSPTVIRAAGL